MLQLYNKYFGNFSPMIENKGMHHGSLLASRIISRCMQIAEFLVVKYRPYAVYNEITPAKTNADEYHYFSIADGFNRCNSRECPTITNENGAYKLNGIQQAYFHGNFHFVFVTGAKCNVNCQVHVIRDGEIVSNFTVGMDSTPDESATLVVPFGGRLQDGDIIKPCCYSIGGPCTVTRGGIDMMVHHITNNPFNTPMHNGGVE